MRLWLILSGISGALAIALGAFGAHGLQSVGDAARISAFETGATYHLIHSVALLAIAGLLGNGPNKPVSLAGVILLIGMTMFAGPLYIYGASGSKALIMVTPIGGLVMIIGWLALAYAGAKRAKG